MPTDVSTRDREWLKYRLITEVTVHMALDTARLVMAYCIMPDPAKTIKSVQPIKGSAFRPDPKYVRRRRWDDAPNTSTPEPPKLDMWGEPISEPAKMQDDPRAFGLLEKLKRKVKPGGEAMENPGWSPHLDSLFIQHGKLRGMFE